MNQVDYDNEFEKVQNNQMNNMKIVLSIEISKYDSRIEEGQYNNKKLVIIVQM